MGIHNRPHALALVETLLVDATWQCQVAHLKTATARIRTKAERAVRAPKIAGAAVAALARDGHVGGQVFAGAKLMANNRSDARKHGGRARTHASHHVMSTTLVCRFTVSQ
ncbi:uncharacterized protein METZ01_LOCUS409829 [marine metagenome]|uniref:Uncharacterized protein n=1 Tax=marine metagenome TaxID=408172 RepID=A0A382WF38_9ZZZZ